MQTHDAIIIGGGHNGLACAAYLARAGMDVLVLERRDLLGGASSTEDFDHPMKQEQFRELMSQHGDWEVLYRSLGL